MGSLQNELSVTVTLRGVTSAIRQGAGALRDLNTEEIHPDGTSCSLSRSQVSLNLGRLADLARFFIVKLQHFTRVK